MCSTGTVIRIGVVFEVLGACLALYGIDCTWRFSGGAGALKTLQRVMSASSKALLRLLHGIARVVHRRPPEVRVVPLTSNVTVTSHGAGALTATLTAEAAGVVTIENRLDRLEWQVQSLTGNVERVECEREALNQTIAGLRGELDAERSEREKGDKRVRATLTEFARNGLWTSLIGVVVLLVAALATGLPAGTEHLLCG
jgi:hypothetical protein